MKTAEFCYWLQGLFELGEPESLTVKQTELIRRHLALVFQHDIDPSSSDDPEVQEKLQAVHDGTLPKKVTPRPNRDRRVRC